MAGSTATSDGNRNSGGCLRWPGKCSWSTHSSSRWWSGLLGGLSLLRTDALLTPGPLSRAVLAGIFVFWLFRLAFQWFVYDSAIWRGRRFYTFMHCAFSLFWIYAVLAYGLALRSVWNG
jgi:hypothetical protein